MNKIKLLFKEHYFTASKHKGGFFTIDNTEGLTKEEIVELEKKGIYNPPIKLPSAPSDAEIEKLFPVNISFFKLKSSGRYVFLHSKYTGKENETRYGNYFSHSLILVESNLSYPVKFIFDNANFKSTFSGDEDVSYIPNLKIDLQIEIENSEFTLEKTFREFQTFFQNNSNRLHVFSKVFDLIVEGKINRQGYNITICDIKENLKDLILAVNYFLPISLANKVSFATYVDNPDSINYPFKITGIIPECGIDRLPEQYFNLIDAKKYFTYIPQQPYTTLLFEIISKGSYHDWKIFMKEFDLFNISELNEFMNIPVSFEYFKKEINNKSISDFKALINSNLPLERVIELKQITIEKNPQLILDYITENLKNGLLISQSYNDKKDAYLKLYIEYFDKFDTFRKEKLPFLVDAFTESLTAIEKMSAYVTILLSSNCKDVQPSSWLTETLQKAEEYFGNELIAIDDKLTHLKSLDDKYILNNYKDRIPNMMKIKTFSDIEKAAKEGKLFNILNKNKQIIKELNPEEKRKLFIIAFNSENVKHQFDVKNFGKYIDIIHEYFEDEGEFWYNFFKKNVNWNPNNEFKKHSLEYLLKKFIVFNFKNEKYKTNLFEKLLPLDEYSMKWIEEEIRETSTKNSIVEEFYKYFDEKRDLKPSTWVSKFNPFK